MLTYRAGIGGINSVAKGMADYLLDSVITTYVPDMELARYYASATTSHTRVPTTEMDKLACQVADGELLYSDALDTLMQPRMASIDINTDIDAIEHTVGTTLADLIERINSARDNQYSKEVVLRQDTSPKLASLLGIYRHLSLSEDTIANLMSGMVTNGSAIAGKTYSTTNPIGFIDLTWSVDKSVSLAWAFAPTEREKAIIFNAHKDAVRAAMWYTAGIIGRVKNGHAGLNGSEPGHITWMEFDHGTSRPTMDMAVKGRDGKEHTKTFEVTLPGDPNLHTHIVVPNVVQTDSGRVGSLYLDKLNGRVKEIGTYFQAQLATNLRKSGIDVVLSPNGGARIAGIEDYAIRHFSKRAIEAETAAKEAAAQQGMTWDIMPTDMKIRFLNNHAHWSRIKHKQGDGAVDQESWQRQADAIGWRHRSVLRPGQEMRPAAQAERIEAAYRASLPLLDAEIQRRAVITDEDARVMACRGLIVSGITGPQDINRVTAEYRAQGVTHNGQHTDLVWAPDPTGKFRLAITTALHESQEAELVSLVRKAHADRSGSLGQDTLNDAISRSRFNFTTPHGLEQLAGLRRVADSGRFGVVVGVAGSGKTAMLEPLVQAWQAENRRVIGLALAWRQTEALGDAGIQARYAIHGFLLKQTHDLRRSDVVVIDEIGQVGTRQLLELLRLRDKYNFRIVALGDPKQCQSIEAGPVIDLLYKALGEASIPKLTMTIRQETERERTISGLFREGQAEAAIGMKRDDSTVRLVAGSYKDTVAHIAALWAERVTANAHDPDYKLTVMTPTNADARAISMAIREERRKMGEIGPDEKIIRAVDQHGEPYDLPIAVGDKVRLFDRINASFGSHGGNIGHNGSVLTVVNVGQDNITLRDRLGREGVVKWDTLRNMETREARVRLAHGDVLTIDAGQGVNATEHIDALVSGSKTANGFKGYVSESRHRRTSYMVISDGAERREIVSRRLKGDTSPVKEDDVWQNVAKNLSRQPMKETATAMLERLVAVSRSTSQAVQQMAMTPPSIAPSRWQNWKIVQSFREAMSAILTSQQGMAP